MAKIYVLLLLLVVFIALNVRIASGLDCHVCGTGGKDVPSCQHVKGKYKPKAKLNNCDATGCMKFKSTAVGGLSVRTCSKNRFSKIPWLTDSSSTPVEKCQAHTYESGSKKIPGILCTCTTALCNGSSAYGPGQLVLKTALLTTAIALSKCLIEQ